MYFRVFVMFLFSILAACAPEQPSPTAQSAFDEEAGPWQTVEINGVLYRRAAAKPTETAQGDLLITIPIQWEHTADGGIRFADTVSIAGRMYTANCNQFDAGGDDVGGPVGDDVGDDVGDTFDTAMDWRLSIPPAGSPDPEVTESQEFYIDHPEDRDVFRIQVPRDVYILIGSLGDIDTQAWLLDSSGSTIVYNDDYEDPEFGVDINFFFGTFLEPGTYYLAVHGVEGATGPYSIFATVWDETGAGKAVASDLDVSRHQRLKEAVSSLAQAQR